tara:strand:- start:220 stop:393 length:174 start_codon:yes stop_codon:yes gene_type:complete
MPIKAGALTGFAEGLEKKLLIRTFGGAKDRLEAVAACHDVVKGTGNFDSDLSGHEGG